MGEDSPPREGQNKNSVRGKNDESAEWRIGNREVGGGVAELKFMASYGKRT